MLSHEVIKDDNPTLWQDHKRVFLKEYLDTFCTNSAKESQGESILVPPWYSMPMLVTSPEEGMYLTEA